MADQEKDKQIDKMLDSLLANYSSAEPRPGLETKILANLRDAEGREAARGWWGFKWLWTGAALTAIVIASVILLGGHRKEKGAVVVHELPASVHPQSPKTQPKPPEMAIKQRERRSHRAAMIPAAQNSGLKPGLRPPSFPTPAPLSEQERLMLAYLSSTPRQEVLAQTQRTDQQEAEAFWEDRNGFSGKRVTR